MRFSRLSTVSPELVASLLGASAGACRRTALSYARTAMQSSRLSDPWLVSVLAELESGARPSASAIGRLTTIVAALDDAAWVIDERAGGAGGEAYVRAFSDARAAAAVLAAVSSGAQEAVLEVAYEAWASGVPLADLFALQTGQGTSESTAV